MYLSETTIECQRVVKLNAQVLHRTPRDRKTYVSAGIHRKQGAIIRINLKVTCLHYSLIFQATTVKWNMQEEKSEC